MPDTKNNPNVIIVADRTLSARYRILFEGIFATMQTTHIPEFFIKMFIAPRIKTDRQGRAQTAPLGCRRMEASLINDTQLQASEVVCTTPETLPSLIGPNTQIVAFSSSDPLGMGMSNTTTKNFWKGQLYTKHWTHSLLNQLNDAKRKYSFKVVAGGAGAWQFHHYPDSLAEDTLDCIYDGYFEQSGPEVFTKLLNDELPTPYIREEQTGLDRIQPILYPSVLGIVELSRGCGRGCRFCTMAHQRMQHVDPEIILEDIRTNINGGQHAIVTASEDFFRYGSDTIVPDSNKLIGLLEAMQQIKGISFLQIDHANIASVAQLSMNELKEIRRLLTFENDTRYLWLNMGIESANGHLVAMNCPSKIKPYRPDDWQSLIFETIEKMNQCGFFPVLSLILGLPGETPDDIEMTRKMVEKLARKQAVVFPIFYEPTDTRQIQEHKGFNLNKMTQRHLALYRQCYEINFRLVPKLFWDNQTAAGERQWKKLFVQTLGRFEVGIWRRKFKALQKQLARNASVSASGGLIRD